MQTIGTLIVLMAIMMACFASVDWAPRGAEYDWIAPTFAFLALATGITGIVVSIVGRVRSGGHV